MPRADRALRAAGALAWGPGDCRHRNGGARRRFPGRRIGGLLTALGLLLTACARDAVPPPDSFYHLELGDPGRRFDAPLLDGVVEVAWPRGTGPVFLRGILHRADGARPRPYRRHAWTDVPSRLLQDAIVGTLRASNAAAPVVTPRAGLNPNWRVRGELKALYIHVSETHRSAVVALTLAVVDADDGTVLLRAHYRARRPVPAPPIPAAVAAVRRALRAVLRRFLDDLARTVSRADPARGSSDRFDHAARPRAPARVSARARDRRPAAGSAVPDPGARGPFARRRHP